MSTVTAVKITPSEQEALSEGELRAWGGLLRAYGCLAKRLDAELAIIDKRRPRPNDPAVAGREPFVGRRGRSVGGVAGEVGVKPDCAR